MRSTSISRVNTATTTTIPNNIKSFTITVVAAASAASPTFEGVALPVGSYSWSATAQDRLEGGDLVTVSGDDVILQYIG